MQGIVNPPTRFLLDAVPLRSSVLTSLSHLQHHRFLLFPPPGLWEPQRPGHGGWDAAQPCRNAPAVPAHTKTACLLWQAHAAENPGDPLCLVVLTRFSSTLRCSPIEPSGGKMWTRVLLNAVVLLLWGGTLLDLLKRLVWRSQLGYALRGKSKAQLYG